MDYIKDGKNFQLLILCERKQLCDERVYTKMYAKEIEWHELTCKLALRFLLFCFLLLSAL